MGQPKATPKIGDVVEMFLGIVREVRPEARIVPGDNSVRVFVEERLIATVWPLQMHVTVAFTEGTVSGDMEDQLDSRRMLVIRPAVGINLTFLRQLLAKL